MSPNETTYWETNRRCPRLPSICQSFSQTSSTFLSRPEQIGWEIPQINLKRRVICLASRSEKGSRCRFRESNFICLIYLSNFLEWFWFSKDINGLHVLTISPVKTLNSKGYKCIKNNLTDQHLALRNWLNLRKKTRFQDAESHSCFKRSMMALYLTLTTLQIFAFFPKTTQKSINTGRSRIHLLTREEQK